MNVRAIITGAGRVLLWAGVLIAVSAVASAEEDHLGFLRGLRQRGYSDMAMLYLEQLASDPNVPAEVKAVVDFERAMTLLQGVGSLHSPEAQKEQIERAQGFLEQFIQQHPRHPLAGRANSELGRLLLSKARVLIWEAEAAGTDEQKEKLREQAREAVKQARAIFKVAHDQHKAAWEAFPKFIDQEKDREQYEKRREAEVRYIRAQIDLALTTYAEAQTYEPDSVQYTNLLIEAAKQFEEIHTRYRSQTGGLYARLWQGKCFEEQGDIQRALGIYNELLKHPGNSETMRQLQDQARHFRLVCLNHPDRKAYELARKEAEEWLQTVDRRRSRTEAGIGIRWELVRALEGLARSENVKPEERERYLRQALEVAREVNRFPGRYKHPSTLKIRELNIALHGRAEEPKDFGTAYRLAQESLAKVSERREALEKARSSGDQKAIETAEADLKLVLNETARLLRLALSLADEDTPLSELQQARYYLAWVSMLMGRYYESAILAEFVARTYKETDPDEKEKAEKIAEDCAFLAVAAYSRAYNESRPEDQEVDLQNLIRVCNMFTRRWPNSPRANEARLTLGRLYSQQNRPVEAAKWFSQIPPSDKHYAEAQVSAGLAYWEAVTNADRLPETERPQPEQLNEWAKKAEEFLRRGIEKLEASLPENRPGTPQLYSAKVNLAQILLTSGRHEEALKVLQDPPHSVVEAIAVEEGQKRPAPPNVKSAEFASFVYQVLLQCYIGIGDTEKAQTVMKQLETLYADREDSAAELTVLYRQLGAEQKKQLERLKATGRIEELQKVKESLTAFLEQIRQHAADSYGTLLWVAETYRGLADGSQDAPEEANTYYQRAAESYEAILKLIEKQPEQADDRRIAAIKLRLAKCKQAQGDFEGALKIIGELAAKKKSALDVQIAAAEILQAWGESGGADTAEKLLLAVNGTKVGGAELWGWHGIASRLYRLLDRSPENRQKYLDTYLQARLNTYQCRLKYALAKPTPKERKAELEKVKQTVKAFAVVSADVPEEWWKQFDGLYQRIQRELGVSNPERLEKPKPVVAVASGDQATDAASQKAEDTQSTGKTGDAGRAATKKAGQRAASQEESGGSLGMIIGGVLVVVVAGVTLFFMVRPQPRSARRLIRPAEAPPVIAGVGASGGSAEKKKLTPAQAAARRKQIQQARAAQARRAAQQAQGASASQAPASQQQPGKRKLTREEQIRRAKILQARRAAEAKRRKENEGQS